MEIYTSNYAKAKSLDDKKYVKVSISRTKPVNTPMPIIPAFMPSADLLQMYHDGRIDWNQYEHIYREELKDVNIREELDFLRYMTKGRDVVLLCYEAKFRHCHRRILAAMINEKYGYEVKEL